jgi:nucleoside-diphosphate-sugar epimerase
MDASDSLLITGSSGFVGLSFLDYLASLPSSARPARIGLLSRSGDVPVPEILSSTSEITMIRADLRAPWNFDFQATKILHLAADGSSNAYSVDAGKGFVEIVENFRDWVEKYPKPMVFHASSGACYGHFDLNGRAGTNSPKSTFIEHRLLGEEIMRTMYESEVIDLRIGRLFSFIGPHIREKKQYAIPHFVASALRNHQVIVTGNPATTRSYLAAEDMSEWIYRAFDPEISSDILDIGSEIPVTMKEVAEFVASLTASQVIYNDSGAHGDYYVADNEETRNRLQVRETRSWQTSLESYIAFCERAMTNER